MVSFIGKEENSQEMSRCKMEHKIGMSEDKQNTLLLAL